MDKSILKKVYIVEQLEYEKDLVHKLFEKNEIDHIFLKGSRVRELYPEPWMRISADVDVLVREKDFQKAGTILKENGHTFSRRDEHSESYRSEVNTQLDLHHDAIPNGRKGYEVAKRVWDDAVLKDGTDNEYLMTTDMLYFIHIAHIAKHFVMGGGNKYSITDVIYMKKAYGNDLARGYLKEANLLDFAELIEEIADHDLKDEAVSDDAKIVREILLDNILLGSHKNSEIGWQIIAGNGASYYKRRLFPPLEKMKEFYPVLNDHKALLPICYIRRMVYAFTSGVWKNKAKEIYKKKDITKEEVEERRLLLEKYHLI